jgi:hypothetical protein
LRKVLTENVYISENEDDRIRQISDGFEICYNVDKLIKKGNYSDDLSINKANELRAKIIKVDEYRIDEGRPMGETYGGNLWGETYGGNRPQRGFRKG